MAFNVGDIVEISISGDWQAQRWFNIWQYEVSVVAGSDTAADIGEAWWNHVKTTYRALAATIITQAFLNVSVKTLESLVGDYGNFPIPAGERVGTRASGGLGDYLPSFSGAGVRLAVATRLTRPGQKRFPFLMDLDSDANALGSAFNALLVTHMNVMDSTMVLGAPAALATLNPVVVSKFPNGLQEVWQPVTGYAVNPNITSQVSRKVGNGI